MLASLFSSNPSEGKKASSRMLQAAKDHKFFAGYTLICLQFGLVGVDLSLVDMANFSAPGSKFYTQSIASAILGTFTAWRNIEAI